MDNKAYKEKLIKRVYSFSLLTIKLVRKLDVRDYASQVIVKQLIRSATSVGANVIEAQASPTRKDFANFITHALKSANESRYWLALLRDTIEINNTEITLLLKEAQELSKILGSTVRSLKTK